MFRRSFVAPSLCSFHLCVSVAKCLALALGLLMVVRCISCKEELDGRGTEEKMNWYLVGFCVFPSDFEKTLKHNSHCSFPPAKSHVSSFFGQFQL